MIKGKILLIVSLLVALALTACAAFAGYAAGAVLEAQMAATLVAYDWAAIKIVTAAVCGVLMLLINLPTVITARQVCRMYNVSRKYAKWSVVTILFGLLLLAACGGAIAYVAYMIDSIPAGLITMVNQILVEYASIKVDVLSLQIACGIIIFLFFLLLFLPLMVSLRGRDGVSALLKKKRTYSDDEE